MPTLILTHSSQTPAGVHNIHIASSRATPAQPRISLTKSISLLGLTTSPKQMCWMFMKQR